MLSLSRSEIYSLVERGLLARVPREIVTRVLIPQNAVAEFVARARPES